jgi:hypothetical protein
MASADSFRAVYNPPITLEDDGVIVVARAAGTNDTSSVVFQADDMPYLPVRKAGNRPLDNGDIVGSVPGQETHDLLLTLHNVVGFNDPHWELLNPASLVGEVRLAEALAAARRDILNTVRTVRYVDNHIANCVGNLPNGNCLGDPMATPAAGADWTAWGASPRGNPSAFDFVGGSTTRNDPITSVAKIYGAYVLSAAVGGDTYTRTVQNCTLSPLNCYTNCNCNCLCNCNCTCQCI